MATGVLLDNMVTMIADYTPATATYMLAALEDGTTIQGFSKEALKASKEMRKFLKTFNLQSFLVTTQIFDLPSSSLQLDPNQGDDADALGDHSLGIYVSDDYMDQITAY